MYDKDSKCEFSMTEILYLVHVINAQGVKVHQENIQTILVCPNPRYLTKLRGFLGICSYYKHFVGGFSQLREPLTDLKKKGNFKWIENS